jgi:hypothetical protein
MVKGLLVLVDAYFALVKCVALQLAHLATELSLALLLAVAKRVFELEVG